MGSVSFLSVLFLAMSNYFSQPMEPSFGGGVSYSYQSQFAKAVYEDATITDQYDTHHVGLLAFFDATWVEASVGLTAQAGTTYQYYKINYDNSNFSNQDSTYYWANDFITINPRILGKLPFKPISECTLFPLAGIEYSYTLKASNLDYFSSKTSDWNDFYLDLGAGMDWQLSSFLRIDNDKPYIRTQILYGINLTPHNSNLDVSGVNYADYGWKLGAEILLGTKF